MTENKIQISFEELSKKMDSLSALDTKLVDMSEKANIAMNALMVIKFTSKYQNLNSTSYLKNMPAFYHLDEGANLKKNSEREFRLKSAESENPNKHNIDDETMEMITQRVDAELNPPRFDDIEEFIKFNKVRSKLIEEKIEEWKKGGHAAEPKFKHLEGEEEAMVPDAGKRFNVITVTNPKIQKVQFYFKEYLSVCLEIVKELRSRHQKTE